MLQQEGVFLILTENKIVFKEFKTKKVNTLFFRRNVA